MSASALLNGPLVRVPERKIGKSSGKPYVSATIRDGKDDAVIWWNILVFSKELGEEMLAFAQGETISVQGSLKVEIYKDALKYSLFVDAILTARRKKREKRPSTRGTERANAGPALGGDPFDDRVPF